MKSPDIKLVEVCDPPVVGSTLYLEESVGNDQGVFLVVCDTGEDPLKKGQMMELKREAVVRLRDWLSSVLESLG